ncbi:16S rRNA (uracil(1498)-N(3))-methyltransferase [Pseudohongiella acticola]|uniref:Ribosomal RNA small subunit methyltransferase E n=1 Tax=Pseudohongiella acticola TaxID=1524254 RepID=A0A1E8CLK7_9GAMM|nr:16S rRNA (uracil(1498)-N(3))-methyltransferase [Pseudohongiella acticola]OFE13356.1 16S rRNA (uracil(1498)-N(3))-methyltransferase [Pseudohongiella acticola]
MRLSRFHTDQALVADTELVLEGDQAHYLGKVLRVKPGQQCLLFNAVNGEFLAEVTSVSKRDVRLLLIESRDCTPDSALPVHLGLGLSRGERMDYAIQKATELGVTDITPLFTDFSEVKLSHERADKRAAHWQKVAISASEQCGRCSVPVIHGPVPLADWVAAVPAGQGFLLDHTGTAGFTGTAPDAVCLLVGPEGGTSDTEKALAIAAGFTTVRLGPRVLRTETAPVVALTALQLQWGDF